jgi:hypothetical protein
MIFVESNLKLKTISCSEWRKWYGNCRNICLKGEKYYRNKIVFIDQVYCNAHGDFHESLVSNMTLFHKGLYIFN